MTVFSIACVAFIIARVLNAPRPFSCAKCLGFWLGMGYAIWQLPYEQWILFPAATCVMALILDFTLMRLKNG